MSPLGIVGLLGALSLTGFVGYEFYKYATAPTGIQKVLDGAEGAVKKYAGPVLTDIGKAGTSVTGELDNYASKGYHAIASLF